MAVLLHILLIIGKVLLILLLIVLAILFILLVCPFFWKVRFVREGDVLKGKAGLSSTLGLVRLNLDYDKGRQDKALDFDLRVFVLPLLKILKRRREKKEQARAEAERQKKEEIRKHIREGTIPGNSPEKKSRRRMPDSIPASERKKRKKKKTGGTEESAGNTFFGTDAGKPGYKLREFFRKLKKGFDTIGDWKAYLESESFARVRLAFGRELPPLLRHLLPKRIRGYLNFGFEDPAVTGKALGGLAMLLGLTDQLKIIPDFQEKKLEADITAKGRIILLTLVIHVLKLVLNKDVRALIRRFR